MNKRIPLTASAPDYALLPTVHLAFCHLDSKRSLGKRISVINTYVQTDSECEFDLHNRTSSNLYLFVRDPIKVYM